MDTTKHRPSGRNLLESLGARAVRDGIPADAIDYCMQVAAARFASECERPVSARDATRLKAYFEGVVRRRTMRSRGGELVSIRQRYILRSVAEDLRDAGFGRDRLIRELSEFCDRAMSEHEIASVVDALEPLCA